MNRIKELRKQKKITQKELAKHLKIADSTLSYWEQGKYEPDIKSLKMLSSYFNASIDYILCSDIPKAEQLGKSVDSVVGEDKTLYNVNIENAILNRCEFYELTEAEVDKLAEYAEFIKSQRNKT